MALRTPSHYDNEKSYGNPDNTPSGDPSDPRVYKPSETRGVYDDQKPTDSSSGLRGQGNFNFSSKKLSPEELQDRESLGSEAIPTKGQAGELDRLSKKPSGDSNNPTGFYSGAEKPGRLTKFRGKFTRRRFAGFAIAGALGIGGVAGFSIIQGPLQFIHFAQSLQKFHFRSNEDFSNRRTVKLLQYTLSDNRVERTRLGITTNAIADKWEAKLASDVGLRPVYSKDTGRFAGYEIVDRGKAKRLVEEWESNGGEIRKVSEASNGGRQEIQGTRKKLTLDQDSEFLDARDNKPRANRALINSVSKATGAFNITSALGSRLLKIRGGVDFAPLKNKARDRADTAADRKEQRQQIREEAAERDRKGVSATEAGRVVSTKDPDGNDITDPQAGQVSDDAQEAIKNAEEQLKSPPDGQSSSSIKSGIAKGLGATAVVGVLCSAKSFGSDIEQYKHANILLPMLRMGVRVVTMGNQVMSGKNVNPDELAAFNEAMYDPATKTSWTNARTVQAEFGQEQTGPDLPPEAQIKNIGDKPDIFNKLDSFPGLNEACSVQDALFGIPGIKQVAGAISAVTGFIADGALGVGGTSTDELVEGALAAASGNSVNLLATGAEFGNLANTGAFMGANDQAISTGGGPLTAQQTAELRALESEEFLYEQSQKTLFARYLDASDPSSLIGSAIISSPSSSEQVINSIRDPLSQIASMFSGAFARLTPMAHAAPNSESIYGAPKYGFSNELVSDPKFENPYASVEEVEREIDSLNEKYGDRCFNLRIILGDGSARVKSETETVNIFKTQKIAECDPEKNRNDLFNQYRLYIADVVNATALRCYDGDNIACSDLGVGGGEVESSNPAPDSGEQLASGDAQALAKKILDSGKVTISPKYLSQIKDIADGKVNCNVNPTILQLIATISEKHTVTITSINRFCTNTLTASGTSSYHYRQEGGHAVDFGIIDGTPSTGGTTKDIELLKEILPLLPSGSGIGQVNCRKSALQMPSGVTQFNDTCNHVHIQVPVKKLAAA